MVANDLRCRTLAIFDLKDQAATLKGVFARPRRADCRSETLGPSTHVTPTPWQMHREPAADTPHRWAFDRNPAAVQLGQARHQRQPQPGALMVA